MRRFEKFTLVYGIYEAIKDKSLLVTQGLQGGWKAGKGGIGDAFRGVARHVCMCMATAERKREICVFLFMVL